MQVNNLKFLLCMLGSLLLTACGGSSSNTPSPEDAVDNSSILQVDEQYTINQSIELILLNTDGSLTDIIWQQTAGPSITLLTSNSKVISFTATESGEYSFKVSYRVNNGVSTTLNKTINVSQENNKLTARLSHAVIAQNKVSLRAAFSDIQDETITEGTITWQQISGPNIAFSERNVDGQRVVYFDAPKVTRDTLLTFTASITEDGINYSDNVAVLVEASPDIANNAYFDDRLAKVFPFNSDSPYADDIVNCVYTNTLTSSCDLATLPLIAAEAELPSVTDIMNRVVVSHQWMGEKFKYFLENNDPNNDFKRLLRATTAIVISYDVRPSFYWVATGAIYLDAENFWLTPQERDTINEAPDYRSDFGKELQFVMPWRYVKNNDYASARFSRNNRVIRTEADGLYRLASLMYHELAHANDFFPSVEWFSHNSNTRVLDAGTNTTFESDALAVVLPLQSNIMRNLARVSFAGDNASSTQKAYLPTDIESFFSVDSASDYYNYSSLREDYAMLFEELMMQSRFGISRDVAITNQPTTDPVLVTDYIVSWGQRGRIGEPSIKTRVSFSALRILPEFDSTSVIDALPSPILMTVGDNWIANLGISTVAASEARTKSNKAPKANMLRNSLRKLDSYGYYHKPIPKH